MSGNNAIADEEAVPPRRDGSGESVQDDMKGSGDEAGVTTRTRSDNGDGAGYGGNTDPTPDPELEAALASVNEKKLMRKIDLYLIPWLSILYLASFLDRSAIGNAKLYNMREDLNLEGQQFNIAVSIFFIPYALFEYVASVVGKGGGVESRRIAAPMVRQLTLIYSPLPPQSAFQRPPKASKALGLVSADHMSCGRVYAEPGRRV